MTRLEPLDYESSSNEPVTRVELTVYLILAVIAYLGAVGIALYYGGSLSTTERVRPMNQSLLILMCGLAATVIDLALVSTVIWRVFESTRIKWRHLTLIPLLLIALTPLYVVPWTYFNFAIWRGVTFAP